MNCPLEADVAKLTARVEALEKQLAHARPAIDEHEDRLDDHERQLEAARAELRELRRDVARIAQQNERLHDIATVQGLTLGKVDLNVRRILEIFEPSVVVDNG
jgi:chromosome segregation ATPase